MLLYLLFNFTNRAHWMRAAKKIHPGQIDTFNHDTAAPWRVLSFSGIEVCVRCLVRPMKLEHVVRSVTISRAQVEAEAIWNVGLVNKYSL